MVSDITVPADRSGNSWQVLTEQTHRLLELVAGLAGGTNAAYKWGSTFSELNSGLMWAEKFMRTHAASLSSTGRIRSPHAAEVIVAEAAVIRNSLLTLHLSMQQEMMEGVNSSLERLRAAETVEEFARMLPFEVVSLGYVRSLFSWVDHMQWVAHSAHSTQGEEESQLLVEAGRQDPLRDLRGFFEFEMIQNRRPILRQGIRASGRVHPEIMNITESDAYVASPLIVFGQVAGFVSLDVHQKTGTVDQFDRDLLGMFTSGAGIALERLQAQERYVSEAGAWFPAGGRGAEGCPRDELDSLTRREVEILGLLSEGHTNTEIAEVLVISEGTAKTHVRNVLRKLGVSNRTQAAAMYRRRWDD